MLEFELNARVTPSANPRYKLESLTLTDMFIDELDLSPFTHLNNLSLNQLPNLQSLDLTPVADMAGYLYVRDTGIAELKAEGLQKLQGAFIAANPLDSASKDNIEKLLGQSVHP